MCMCPHARMYACVCVPGHICGCMRCVYTHMCTCNQNEAAQALNDKEKALTVGLNIAGPSPCRCSCRCRVEHLCEHLCVLCDCATVLCDCATVQPCACVHDCACVRVYVRACVRA